MSLVLKDRVRETATVVGTGDAALSGAVTGFQSFAVVGNTNTCYYAIADQSGSDWEVGIGTYSTTGPTLARTTVLSSSNSGSKVAFTGGTKDVFLTYPSEKAVYLDESGNLNIYSDGELRLNDATGGEYVALKSPAALSASYTLTMPVDDGTNGQALVTDGSGNLSWSTAASGDVYGPASSTDTAVALFDGNTGKLIKNSGVTIDGSNNVSGVAQLNATTADLTNLEVTNIKAKDGTAAISIADSTGVVTGSTPQVISVNSSSDALRITQTGSGNALVVEDSANPDSTPFVIDANGNFFKGYTSSISVEFPMGFQINGTAADSGTSQTRWANNTGSSAFYLAKSRGSAVATRGIVQNGDPLGFVQFAGDDGANFVVGANIHAAVDGTPGTNDMPGRLVFSTTADGASSPTERMRIDNAGRVGIGITPNAGEVLNVSKNPVGEAGGVAFTIRNYGTIQSSVTSAYYGNIVNVNTQATAFTLPNLYYNAASQGTFGAGSTVTSQYGYAAFSNLTGATNNYGFYSNIAAATGRYNFYAAGSADNYFAGRVGIGGVPSYILDVRADNNSATTYMSIDNSTGLAGTSSAGIYFSNQGTPKHSITAAVRGADYMAFNVGSGGVITERMRIDSSGNLIQSAPTTPPTLSTNGTMVFNLTSNTNLRVSVRGSDGVTRTANITLA